MKGRVSIILTVLNGEKTLLKLLESIDRQTHEDIEVIFVDGGSTDQSAQIFNRYSFNSAKAKYIDNSSEVNIVDSYRVGFDNSSGDYIMTIGHDDYFINDEWLSYCSNFLLTGQCELIYGYSIVLGNNFKEVHQLSPSFDRVVFDEDASFLNTLITKQIPNDTNAIMRRQVFDECFPHKDEKELCFLYVPHDYFYKQFFLRRYKYKFSYMLATASIGVSTSSKRTIRYKHREDKCRKVLRRWYVKVFLIKIFHVISGRSNVSVKHALRYIKLSFFIFALYILYKFSIDRLVFKVARKYFP